MRSDLQDSGDSGPKIRKNYVGDFLFNPFCSLSTFYSLVYLLFPTFRETLQGGFLEVFNLFSGQFSVYVPVNVRENILENHYFPY